MNNFGGGNCPQTNPQSLFGGIQMQQRGQAGMPSMTGSNHPPFGVSGLQTNSIQQQAHNQFMINRQGNSLFIFMYTNMSMILPEVSCIITHLNCFIFIGMNSHNAQPQGWPSPSHGNWHSNNMGQTAHNIGGVHPMPNMSPGGGWSNRGKYCIIQ